MKAAARRADARDVAQEVYIKVFRGLTSCKDLKRFDAWVYRITINAARDSATKFRKSDIKYLSKDCKSRWQPAIQPFTKAEEKDE